MIESIASVTKQTVARSEEVSAATEEQFANIESLSGFAGKLDDIAQKLEKSISEFKM